MFKAQVVRFPTLGYNPGFPSLATRPYAAFKGPYATLGAVGALGDVTDVLGGLNLQTAALAGIGAWMLYKVLFSTTAQVRRKQLGEVRRKYRSERREVREKLPLFG